MQITTTTCLLIYSFFCIIKLFTLFVFIKGALPYCMGSVLISTSMDAALHSNSITDAIQMHYLSVKLIYFASKSVHEWSYWRKKIVVFG